LELGKGRAMTRFVVLAISLTQNGIRQARSLRQRRCQLESSGPASLRVLLPWLLQVGGCYHDAAPVQGTVATPGVLHGKSALSGRAAAARLEAAAAAARLREFHWQRAARWQSARAAQLTQCAHRPRAAYHGPAGATWHLQPEAPRHGAHKRTRTGRRAVT
jgi:hypothetical protein